MKNDPESLLGMPFSPLQLATEASVDDASRSETARGAEQIRGRTGFLHAKSRSFTRARDVPIANADFQSPAATLASNSAGESTRWQLSRRLQLSLPLRGVVGEHGNQSDESHRLARPSNNENVDSSKTIASPLTSVSFSASNKRRRFSVDSGSSTSWPRRRLDQRRSTSPLPYQVALALRLACPSLVTTRGSLEDTRSPRVLRHICALNSPGKRHWTPVERLCCEVRATEEDYVDDLRRLIDYFFLPLTYRAAEAHIQLGPLSELHTATRFLLHVHEELLALMSENVERLLPATPDEMTVTMPVESSTDGRTSGSRGDAPATSDIGDDALDSDDDVTHPNQSGHETGRGLREPPVRATQIAKAFVSMAQYMKAYALYCAAHRPATDELNALQKKHPRLFFDLDALDAGLTVPDVLSELIKPVQRICRYPMLLRSLVDQSVVSTALTATNPSDVALLREALDAIERVSDLVNARVRDAQNNARLLELFASLPVSGRRRAARAKVRLLRPARTFVCEVSAAVQVIRLSPRWRWLRTWSSLLLYLHLPRRFHRRTRDDEAEDSRGSELREPLAECEHCERARCMPSSPCAGGVLDDGATSRGEQSRLVLLSDVLLMAKKCGHKLQIRRQICLSCAFVSETDPDEHKEATLVLQAAKVGRCHCHQLTPATLQQPLPGRRRSTASGSDQTAASIITNTFVAIGSNDLPSRDGAREQSGGPRRRLASPLPLRASRRYLLRFNSAEAKAEFASQLRDAIAKCARVELPPPPAPQSSRSSSRASKRLVAKRLWRSLTHPELAVAAAATVTTDTAAPDAVVGSQSDERVDGRRHRRCTSLTAAMSCRRGADESVVSSIDSLDGADAILVSVTDSHDEHGAYV